MNTRPLPGKRTVELDSQESQGKLPFDFVSQDSPRKRMMEGSQGSPRKNWMEESQGSPLKRMMEESQDSPRKRVMEGSQDSPIKNRLTTSFWKRKSLNFEPESTTPEPKLIKINELHVEKSNGRIRFRVSLLGALSEGRQSFLKFHALDDTGEVAVFAYEKAVEFAGILKINGLYILEKFEVRKEPAEYCQFTGTNVQLKVLPESRLIEYNCEDFPEIPFNFIGISDVFNEKYQIMTRVDIFGVIAQDYGIEETRGGSKKRDIRITDQSKSEVILTLWGEMAQRFAGDQGEPIALRKAVIKAYKDDRLLSASGYSLIWVNPAFEDDRCSQIKMWFKAELEQLGSDDVS